MIHVGAGIPGWSQLIELYPNTNPSSVVQINTVASSQKPVILEFYLK
jgi:hypothetical protein